MTYQQYESIFAPIIAGEHTSETYQDEQFVEYTKLNQRRHKRWNKTGVLTDQMKSVLDELDKDINVVVITEHWCGDSAHALPFVQKMVEFTDKISLEIQLRDEDSEIDQYLTNGSKSIPKIIFRNEEGKDIGVWGARPKGATELRERLIEEDIEIDERKKQLQQWYNQDKGGQIQEEWIKILQSV